MVRYSVSETQKVEISIFNSLGQKSRTLVNSEQNPGDYNISWDGKNDSGNHLQKGFYFIQISGSAGRSVSRLIKN
jgi:flagellar hook assembly protein FlgD